jgi:ABC-type multidrug transport system fused ATPase/permease subunit
MKTKKSLKTISKFLYLLSSRQKQSLVTVFFLLLLGTVLEMIGIAILVPLLSIFSGNNKFDNLKYFLNLNNLTSEKLVLYFVAIIVLFYLFKFLFLVFLSWKQSDFITNLSYKLTSDLFRGYLNQPYLFHIQNNSSILLRNLQAELGQFTTYTQSAVLLILELMTIFGIGSVLVYNQPMAAFIAAFFLLIVVYFFNKYTKNKIVLWGKVRQEQAEKINKNFFQGLGGIKEVKFFRKENHFYKLAEQILKTNSEISTKYLTIGQIPRYFLEFMALLGIFIIIVVMQLKGMTSNTIFPILGLYLAASFRIIPSINRVLNSLQTMKYLNPVIDVLFKEFHLINSNKVSSQALDKITYNNQIELKNICFKYPNSDTKVIKNLSIKIDKGATIGIIGKSGSGKSTLIDILLGLHKQTSGEILVDGINIDTNIGSWQQNIGYVPQNVYLIDDTINANVAFGIEPELINEDFVDKALKSAQLSELISTIPGGKNSIVGERGIKLSGGQKQRIGIARALYSNPDILVLDEATSSLDNENESNFMKTILNYKNSKTIIIVAHRISTLRSCDIIYEISKGQIIKTYKPDELIKH